MRFLLAIAGLLLVAGCGATAAPAIEPVTTPADAPTVELAAVAEPATVEIPRLGVSDEVVPVEICAAVAPPECTSAGGLEVPDVSEVGYYTGSPRPGVPGPALLAGHVNYKGVTGSFADIGTLQTGDEITVTDRAGAVHRFVVYASVEFAKADYDAHMPALLANTDGPELRLVTCSGDLVGHSYLSNTVVSARAA